MVAENFEVSKVQNNPSKSEFSDLNLMAAVEQKPSTQVLIPEMSMKTYLENTGIPDDMNEVGKVLKIAKDLNCDTRAQSPAVTGKPAQDACGIEISKLYPKLEESVALALGENTTGTAFKLCVEDQCYYVTNDHVVGNKDNVGLATADDKQIQFLKVVSRNPENDLALIEAPPGDKRKGLTAGEQSKTGEPVFTFGHPLGFPKDVINAGLVIEVRTPFKTVDQHSGAPKTLPKAVISTAHSRPGQSGSPEFNTKGEVVGVKVMGIDVGGEFGTVGSVSIPVEDVVKMIREQKK